MKTTRSLLALLMIGGLFACDTAEQGNIGNGMGDADVDGIYTDDARVQADAGVESDGAAATDAGPGPEADAGGDLVMAAPCIATVMVGETEVFAFEASRTDATAVEPGFDGSAGVCSQRGVLPWTGLTWPDANRVCMQAGFRLCSNDEWQAACQGPRGWFFPYGSAHQSGRCNDHVSGSGMMEPTGNRPECSTPEGVRDMSGNAWELTADASRRGASWKVNAVMFRVDSARCDVAYQINEGFADDDVGFRCCR